MIVKKKKLPINIAILVIILYSIMPCVSRFISTYLTTYFYLLILLFSTASVVLVNGVVSLNKNIYILLPFLAWRVLMLLSSTSDITLWFYQSLIELMPVILGIYILEKRKRASKIFLCVIIGAFLLTIVTTISGLIVYPDAARWLAAVSSSQDNEMIQYDWLNIGGYNFVYSIILLYPVIIFAYKKKKMRLIWAIPSALLILTLTIMSGYTTALLFFCITSCLFLFNRKITKKEILMFILVLVLVIVFANSYLSKIFGWLAQIIDNENIAYRLQLLADGKTALINSADERIILYGDSLNTFLQNPFFGTLSGKEGKIGGHSFILDYLANYGLFGAFFLVYMYRRIYYIYYKPYQGNYGYGFVFWCFIQAIALSCLNTGMWLYVLTLYIPCCVNYIIDEEGTIQKHEKNFVGGKFSIRSYWRENIWKKK